MSTGVPCNLRSRNNAVACFAVCVIHTSRREAIQQLLTCGFMDSLSSSASMWPFIGRFELIPTAPSNPLQPRLSYWCWSAV